MCIHPHMHTHTHIGTHMHTKFLRVAEYHPGARHRSKSQRGHYPKSAAWHSRHTINRKQTYARVV